MTLRVNFLFDPQDFSAYAAITRCLMSGEVLAQNAVFNQTSVPDGMCTIDLRGMDDATELPAEYIRCQPVYLSQKLSILSMTYFPVESSWDEIPVDVQPISMDDPIVEINTYATSIFTDMRSGISPTVAAQNAMKCRQLGNAHIAIPYEQWDVSFTPGNTTRLILLPDNIAPFYDMVVRADHYQLNEALIVSVNLLNNEAVFFQAYEGLGDVEGLLYNYHEAYPLDSVLRNLRTFKI